MEACLLLQFLGAQCAGAVGRDGVDLGKAGSQIGQHILIVLVGQHAQHADEVFLKIGAGQGRGQHFSAVGVVAAVKQQQRMAAQHLDAGGHPGIGKALQNGVVRNIIAELAPESQRDLDSHGGVVSLVRAGQAQCGAIAAVVDAVFQPLAAQQRQIVLIGRNDARVRLGSGSQDRPHSLRRLVGVVDDNGPFFYNTGLFGGDFIKGIPQDLHVVITDLCDGRHELVGHDVRCVAAPAEAGFQHDQVTLFAGKPEKRQRGDSLKLHRLLAALGLDGVNRVEHLLGQVCQRAGRDHLAVDLEPLTEVHHIRADGQTGLVARRRQDGGRHGRKAALAVRACNVDALQLLFGVSQVVAQVLHPGQTGCALPHARQGVQGVNCLLGRHSSSSS